LFHNVAGRRPPGREQASPILKKEAVMAVAKTIEISAESPKSFEDAINQGIAEANKSVRNIQEVWVKDQKVAVENGKPSAYRAHLSVTFVLDQS
jgi:flavin-binding protein dodecin